MTLKKMQLLSLVVLLVFAAGCSDDEDGTTNPPATTAKVLMATLNGATEVPAVAGSGSGTGSFVLNAAGTELTFEVSIGGLTGAVAGAHFHNAAAGNNGGVVRDIMGDLVGSTFSGTWKASDTQALTADLVTALLAGEIYVNVHTAANAGGEIRGQLMVMSTGTFYDASLDAAQEVTATKLPIEGSGSGFFVLDDTESSLNYYISFGGLSGDVTAAHFHNAGVGENGGVVWAITGDLVGNMLMGTWTSESDPPLTTGMVTELKAGRLYVNLHTAADPGGEIRGQILSLP